MLDATMSRTSRGHSSKLEAAAPGSGLRVTSLVGFDRDS
jgi:hypothetical protein